MNFYDLTLCIDNNDNQMTLVGHIVYLCPSKHRLLLGPQINYMPSKSHVIVLFSELRQFRISHRFRHFSQCSQMKSMIIHT